MLIACVSVVVAFIIFVTVTYFLTKKSYVFEVDGKKVKVANAGSNFKIFINEHLESIYHSPQLIKGEEFNVKVGNKEVLIICKSNAFGTKLSVKAMLAGQEIYNNEVIVK